MSSERTAREIRLICRKIRCIKVDVASKFSTSRLSHDYKLVKYFLGFT